MFDDLNEETRDYLEARSNLLVEIETKLNCTDEEIDFISDNIWENERDYERILLNLKGLLEAIELGYDYPMIRDLLLIAIAGRTEV